MTFLGRATVAAPAPSRTRWLRDLWSALAIAIRAGRRQFREEREWQARSDQPF